MASTVATAIWIVITFFAIFLAVYTLVDRVCKCFENCAETQAYSIVWKCITEQLDEEDLKNILEKSS